jgi:hypothetical protein
MTEDEATKKWCPMVRAGNEAGCNRNGPPIINGRQVTITHCIASECMWWSWDWSPTMVEEIKSKQKDFIGEPEGHCGAVK